MKKQILYFLLFFSFSLVDAGAQRLDMRFYDPFKDLPLTNTYITGLAQDTSGIIWIGSKDGLNTYNGTEVVQFFNDPQDSTSLIDNNISHVFIDSFGRIWVATNIGLCLYDPVMNNFKRLVTALDLNGVVSPNTTKVVEDKNHNIYIVVVDGVYLFDEEKASFSEIVKIGKGGITEVLFDDQNNLWISGNQGGGLYYFDRSEGDLVTFNEYIGGDLLMNEEIFDIVFYHGRLYIAMYGDGLASVDLTTKDFKSYKNSNDFDAHIINTYVDNDDRLWVCDLSGLKLFDEELDIFYGYYAEGEMAHNFKKNITAIFQDRQGSYWTTHNPGGVSVRNKPRGFRLTNKSDEWYWHTTEENITSFTMDDLGNWWIGNHYNGIDVFDWAHTRMITYLPGEESGLGKGTVFAMLHDSNQELWVGTNMSGLQKFNKRDSTFSAFLHDEEEPTSIASNDVRSIAEDKSGNLWLAVHGKGVDMFDRRSNTFKHYSKENNNLSNAWTYKVFVDKSENVWVASSWGLSKLPPGEEQFITYLNNVDDQSSLPNNEINDIFQDSKGDLWFATDIGICKYNRQEDNFIRYQLGFKNNFTCAIEEDSKGNLWVSTYDGLYCFNPLNNRLFYFSNRDGLQDGEFNRNASFKDGVGTLFFGGVNGLTSFIPEKLNYNNQPPGIRITKLSVFNEEVKPNDATGILNHHIAYTKEIKLEYTQNVIGFEFAAINMINPEKNQYRYILQGFDKDWVDVGTRNTATYTNLNPGNYVFKVIASNNDQVWNEEGVSLSIVVRPPWWMTWWFRLILILMVVLAVALIVYVRTARLKNQKLILEKMVEDRTQRLHEKNQLLKQQKEDLNEINALLEERTQQVEEQSAILIRQTDDLKDKNSELEKLNITKDKFFSIVAHDLKNPFHAILSLSEMFYTKFDKLTDEDKIKMAGYINNSGKIVYNLLENLLNWARSQSDQIVYNPKDLDIFVLIDENVQLMKNNAEEKEISICFHKGADIKVHGDRDMLNTILRNLISNAIKFTENNGKVDIRVTEDDQFATVEVADNGVGMEKEVVDKLFNIDKKNSRQGTSGEKGSALGLVLCKDFVERNGGRISVESTERKGSTFRFTVPLSSVGKVVG